MKSIEVERTMDTICANDIKMLIQDGDKLRVSIFLPTHHRGGVDQQDPIRLKNLLRKAEEKLSANGLRPAEARSLIKPAEMLLTDNLFWRQQGDGLAVFIEDNQYFYYRIPMELKEEVGVGKRFYIRPILPMLSVCGFFYVLAISRNDNRLLQCTPNGAVRIDLPDVPKDLVSALNYTTPDNRMQYHVPAPAGGSNFGGATAIQTGEGSRPDYEKRNILQYFHQIDKGVIKYLKEETAPLVLASVDYLHSLYRATNEYRNLQPEGILGNPDGVADKTLCQQAADILKSYFDNLMRSAASDFHRAVSTGITVTGLVGVVTAAFQGRVRFLFIDSTAQQWGDFNRNTNTVTVHSQVEPRDDDLIDFAAYQTLKHAGTIFIMKPEEVPGNTAISATLRF
jgi:hypothetical protein